MNTTDKKLLAACVLFGALGIAMALGGCASTGADAARQAEATTNAMIGSGYRGLKAYVHTCDQAAIAVAQTGDAAKAQKTLDGCRKVADVGLQLLDTACAATDAADSSIAVAEKIKSKDYSGVIGQLVKIGLDLVTALGVNGVKIPGVQ